MGYIILTKTDNKLFKLSVNKETIHTGHDEPETLKVSLSAWPLSHYLPVQVHSIWRETIVFSRRGSTFEGS